jgi:RNA polymerase sigma-70 factor, ECF subfamily
MDREAPGLVKPGAGSDSFPAQVEAMRPYLMRYASLTLRNREAAEDAVQETLLAALSAETSFEGRSNLRTWMTGILKHKCVDAVRRAGREVSFEDGEAGAAEFDALFDERGHWHELPKRWEDPDGALQQKQFLQALEACLAALPRRTAEVFMLREHVGLDTAEICKQLAITANHCWVLLYRARMALRMCLEKNWFAK